jgi:hypothetical protein
MRDSIMTKYNLCSEFLRPASYAGRGSFDLGTGGVVRL